MPRLASTLPHPLLPQLGQINPPPSSNQIIPPTPQEHALEIEFENAWETTSDWNEDDEEAAIEESDACARERERSAMASTFALRDYDQL